MGGASRQISNMPKPKGNGDNLANKIAEAAAQQGKPDPSAEVLGQAAKDTQAPAAEAPLPTSPANPVAPVVPAAPPEPVAQQMVNATPERPTPIGAKLEKAGAAGNVQSAAAPAATYAGPPPAMQQAAMRPGAGAMAANQISTGASQFMAPNMNGITFGGS
jgi:hypothetical protein